MNIHEYQAKQILRDCKIAVPDGSVASSVTEAIDKAKKLLNWEPQVTLLEGLKETIRWFLA